MNQRRKTFHYSNRLLYILPSLIFLILVGGNFWGYKKAQQLTHDLIKSQCNSAALQTVTKLEFILFERRKDLEHLRSLWGKSSFNSKEERFRTDAMGIMSRELSYSEIDLVGSDGNVLSHVSLDSSGYRDTIISRLSSAQISQSIRRSKSALIKSGSKEKSQFLAVFSSPILKRGEVQAAVAGILKLDTLIKKIAFGSIPEDFAAEMVVNSDTVPLTLNSNSSGLFSAPDRSETEFKAAGLNWKIIVYPPKSGLLGVLTRQNRTYFILNSIVILFSSLLIAFAVYSFIEQKKTLSSLRRSEERYQRLTENAKDIIFRKSLPSGRYEYISPSVKDVTGFSPQDFYSSPLFIKNLLAPEWRSTFENFWSEILNGSTNPTFEFKIIKKNGEPGWLHQRNVILFEDGTPSALEGIITDITEQKSATREREQLIKELEKKNADLERFTYTISHELRQPLITIKGFLGYLEENAQKGQRTQLHQDIMQIIHATETMQRLLNDLISLNRIGLATRKAEPLDLSEIAQAAVDLFKEKINLKGIDVQIDRSMPEVIGYRSELFELFQNIIENSVKFTSDQPSPYIKIGTVRTGEETVFFIKDNGIGFKSKYKDKIFGLFDKLHSDTEGTGVGLALAKRIVEHHGGWIRAESEGPGKGTTFYFTLPFEPVT
ncbi:MAG: PAS domain-containing protein [Fibrobacter sp.]|nr:PAS domain-containing protein [Fibrobacter sp.]